MWTDLALVNRPTSLAVARAVLGAGGIKPAEPPKAWNDVTCHAACPGVEIAELNPLRDEGQKTVQLVGTRVAEAFANPQEKTS